MSELTPAQVSAARRKAATAQHERGERMVKRLFKSDAETHLRAQAHAEYSRTRGPGVAFNQHEADRHADAVVAAMAPVLAETTLTGPEALELRREMTRAPTTAEQSAARMDQFVELARKPIYGTKRVIEAKAKAAKAAAHQSPALRKALNTGNAANSVVLGRALLRRVEEGEPILRKPAVIIK
jgi:hypothetical protein